MQEKEGRRLEISRLLSKSYRLFESGVFDEARRFLNEAHSLDFENTEVRSALRACGFWKERADGLSQLPGDGSRGDYLRRHWRVFDCTYRRRLEHPLNEGCNSLKTWVHTEALGYYKRQAAVSNDPEALLQAGRCHKTLGRFEECRSTLEAALRLSDKSDARLLAELADAYAAMGETRAAKVLMREALFLDAGSVDIGELAAPLFLRLIERAEKETNAHSPGFPEWLPVYGALWGVFDVKRELSPVEYGKLKQKIYALKSEMADGDEQDLLRPKLINHYLRMIDHYQATGADRSVMDEVLIEIKLLSPAVYRNYLE